MYGLVLEDLNHLENMLNEIIVLAMKTEEYKYIVTIPGLSKNTAARISAEIAGIDRFSSASKFVAYIGIISNKHLGMLTNFCHSDRCICTKSYLVESRRND